ncbi:hypothetical protein [Aeromicrobium sp. A1-2]|uniref:hypothetical protein n=1 Tax=Aeromicrobium sp. A1-2 TaxID=2107713 RepID=UPI0013C2B78B|nr:hypothetical protein [Aeromicrobium sp. A1-2]
MISRRALLGTGAATAAAAAGLGIAAYAHQLDDLARLVGLEPKPEPDPGDDRLIVSAAADQNALLAIVEATAATHTGLRLARFVQISTEHAKAVGVAGRIPEVPIPPSDQAKAASALAAAYATAATARAADAGRASSPDLARVLASMSAGLDQCARAVGELA